MSRSWSLYLDDILGACQNIFTYTDRITYEDFLADNKTRDAVIHNIGIIGEAIKQLPDAVRQKAPGVEWRNISRMRDRIVHTYFGLDYQIVWDTAQNHVPTLLAAVTSIREQGGGDG